MIQKTFYPKASEIPKANWYLIDASGQTLGRLASNIARILKGKHLPTYTPSEKGPDHVIVINASEITVTGQKATGKIYDRYSGYPSGRRERTFEQQHELEPTRNLETAIRGMLPHNTLGELCFKRLRVYPGAEHEQIAQQPKAVSFGKLGELIASS